MTTDSDVFHCQYYFPFDRNVYVLSAAAGRAQLRGAVSSPALAARVERVLGLGSGERLVVAVPRHGGTDYDEYDPSDIPPDQARPGDQAASLLEIQLLVSRYRGETAGVVE